MLPRRSTAHTEMSLKAFHLFFIVLATILTAFTAAWAFGQFRADHGAASLAAGGVCTLSGMGLAIYAARFRQKARRL
jgi:hypothetical protein